MPCLEYRNGDREVVLRHHVGQRTNDFGNSDEAKVPCDGTFDILDAQLDVRSLLAGESFRMGDTPAATSLFRYFETGIAVPKLPHVRTWYARFFVHPAYREYVWVPFDELRGRRRFEPGCRWATPQCRDSHDKAGVSRFVWD